MDRFRYIKIHTWIRGLGSHKVIYFVLLPKPRNQVGINHSGSKACVLKVEGTAVHEAKESRLHCSLLCKGSPLGISIKIAIIGK